MWSLIKKILITCNIYKNFKPVEDKPTNDPAEEGYNKFFSEVISFHINEGWNKFDKLNPPEGVVIAACDTHDCG